MAPQGICKFLNASILILFFLKLASANPDRFADINEEREANLHRHVKLSGSPFEDSANELEPQSSVSLHSREHETQQETPFVDALNPFFVEKGEHPTQLTDSRRSDEHSLHDSAGTMTDDDSEPHLPLPPQSFRHQRRSSSEMMSEYLNFDDEVSTVGSTAGVSASAKGSNDDSVQEITQELGLKKGDNLDILVRVL